MNSLEARSHVWLRFQKLAATQAAEDSALAAIALDAYEASIALECVPGCMKQHHAKLREEDCWQFSQRYERNPTAANAAFSHYGCDPCKVRRDWQRKLDKAQRILESGVEDAAVSANDRPDDALARTS